LIAKNISNKYALVKNVGNFNLLQKSLTNLKSQTTKKDTKMQQKSCRKLAIVSSFTSEKKMVISIF